MLDQLLEVEKGLAPAIDSHALKQACPGKGAAETDGDFADRRLLPGQVLFSVNARHKDPQNRPRR